MNFIMDIGQVLKNFMVRTRRSMRTKVVQEEQKTDLNDHDLNNHENKSPSHGTTNRHSNNDIEIENYPLINYQDFEMMDKDSSNSRNSPLHQHQQEQQLTNENGIIIINTEYNHDTTIYLNEDDDAEEELFTPTANDTSPWILEQEGDELHYSKRSPIKQLNNNNNDPIFISGDLHHENCKSPRQNNKMGSGGDIQFLGSIKNNRNNNYSALALRAATRFKTIMAKKRKLQEQQQQNGLESKNQNMGSKLTNQSRQNTTTTKPLISVQEKSDRFIYVKGRGESRIKIYPVQSSPKNKTQQSDDPLSIHEDLLNGKPPRLTPMVHIGPDIGKSSNNYGVKYNFHNFSNSPSPTTTISPSSSDNSDTPRRPGRPRKYPLINSPIKINQYPTTPTPTRGPGRPRKIPKLESFETRIAKKSTKSYTGSCLQKVNLNSAHGSTSSIKVNLTSQIKRGRGRPPKNLNYLAQKKKYFGKSSTKILPKINHYNKPILSAPPILALDFAKFLPHLSLETIEELTKIMPKFRENQIVVKRKVGRPPKNFNCQTIQQKIMKKKKKKKTGIMKVKGHSPVKDLFSKSGRKRIKSTKLSDL